MDMNKFEWLIAIALIVALTSFFSIVWETIRPGFIRALRRRSKPLRYWWNVRMGCMSEWEFSRQEYWDEQL